MNLVNNSGSGLPAPKAVNIYLSENGTDFTKSTSVTSFSQDQNVSYVCKADVTGLARYVKVEFELAGMFAFVNEIKVMGKNKDTIRFEKNGITYIKFFGKALIEQLQQYDEMKINVVGKTAVKNWQGRTTPQIMIEDLEVEDAKLAF